MCKKICADKTKMQSNCNSHSNCSSHVPSISASRHGKNKTYYSKLSHVHDDAETLLPSSHSQTDDTATFLPNVAYSWCARGAQTEARLTAEHHRGRHQGGRAELAANICQFCRV